MFGQNQPQGISAPSALLPNSKELEEEIDLAQDFIQSATQELEQVKNKIRQLGLDQGRIRQKITNLEKYVKQYKTALEKYAELRIICEEQKNDLENERAQVTERYFSLQSENIEQCFSNVTARMSRVLYTQNIKKETRQLISDLSDDLRLAGNRGKILDVEKNSLEAEIIGLGSRLEDLQARLKRFFQEEQ